MWGEKLQRLDEFFEKYKDYDEKKFQEEKKNILKFLEKFNGHALSNYFCMSQIFTSSSFFLLSRYPFTLQRVCELVSRPEDYYKNTKKYLYALQKVLMITGKLEELNVEEYNKEVVKLAEEFAKLSKSKPANPPPVTTDKDEPFEIATKINPSANFMDTSDD